MHLNVSGINPNVNDKRSREKPRPPTVAMTGPSLPAHDLDAELAVLGALLRDPEQIAIVQAIIAPDDFYRDSHAIVCRHIYELCKSGIVPDLISVNDSLVRSDESEKVGGFGILLEMSQKGELAYLASQYAAIVRETSDHRSVAHIAEQLLANSYSREKSPEEAMSWGTEQLAQRMGRSLGVETSISLGTIEPEDVGWVWRGRIPKGKLTTFAGPGGLGKTFVALDTAARVTVGGEIPDRPEERFERGSVLFISAEDEPADTLVPRLIAAGADRSKVHILSPLAHGRFSLADIATLTRVVQKIGDVRLVIIDPPTAYLGQTDDHKNAELRALLAPLATFATKHELAVLLVTHVSKSTSSRASDRIIGSVAWSNAVRAAWLFKKDDGDKLRRLLLPAKNNLAPNPTGLAYRIESKQIDGVRDPVGYVVWEPGGIDLDADEACAAERSETSKPRGRKPQASVERAQWLWKTLGDRSMRVGVLVEAARKVGLIAESLSPLYNAKDRFSDVYPGHSIEEFLEEPPGGIRARSGGSTPRKSWRIVPPPPETEVDDGNSTPY